MSRTYHRRKSGRCGKDRYDSHSDAQVALGSVKRSRAHGNEARRERRVYFCPSCHGYHLTSK